MQSDWYRETFTPKWRFSRPERQGLLPQHAHGRAPRDVGRRQVDRLPRACVVVDDPISARDRRNAARHEAVADWWDKVMSSRLNDQRTGARVIVHQRLDEKDLTGHVLAKGGYQHLCLPTEFDPKRRSVTVTKSGRLLARSAHENGELLFPRSSRRRRRADQDRSRHVRLQRAARQKPLALSGGIFSANGSSVLPKRDLPPVFHEQMQSWDLTFKKKEDSDFVVGQVWARLGTSCYLRFGAPRPHGLRESKKRGARGVGGVARCDGEARRGEGERAGADRGAARLPG
jgi:hypothetical protein